jgi:ADP-Ribosyltransferase in polyvalent proteins
MEWYVVTKRIKGRAYYYRQKTWREGKRVRTRSEYIGPGDQCYIAFHGTFAKFDTFDSAYLGDNTDCDDSREGFFFASNEQVSVSYASTYLAASRGLEQTRRKWEEKISALAGCSEWEAEQKLDNGEYHDDLETENRLKSYLERLRRAQVRLSNLTDRGVFKRLQLHKRAYMKVQRLAIKKPYIYDMEGRCYDGDTYMDAIEEAHMRGCDGVIIRNTYDGLTPSHIWAKGKEARTNVYIVFSEDQILPFD